ncbi:MAG: hydroxymethylbilane synthase [Alphaproteobacteria bacterium]|nr:hydroxymethylbilane synthase [Alphaproteobacteria bacterium]
MTPQPGWDDDDVIPDDIDNSDALVMGTRGSPLALAQAKEVAMTLVAASAGMFAPPDLLVIKTTGDKIQDRPLADAGGKGLFTKEIDAALLAGHVDIAVHSMKDLPTELPDNIVVGAVLPREDPRDVLIGAKSIAALPKGARLGTSSLRRGAQVRGKRPDVEVVQLRGNVQTRIKKLQEGVADATLLALAGLHRLGIDTSEYSVLDPSEMLPAVAQGAIAITCRADDAPTVAMLARITHAASERAVTAERALLAALEGSCRTPIAALAEIDDETLTLRAAVISPDGAKRYDAELKGSLHDAERMGRDAGAELKKRAGPNFFTA